MKKEIKGYVYFHACTTSTTFKLQIQFSGLQEAEKQKKKLRNMGQTFMMAKAISIMSAPRRNREKAQKTFGKQRRSSSLFGVGSIAMKAGSAKSHRKQSKRPSEIIENDEEEEEEFSASANAMLIRGLGNKFSER